jgi:3-hydroxyisobutyrate dehydrogenase-like beta-hydroxyacid dehydrogenase
MKLAFCGLGLMGAPMVRRLLAAGHGVKVWNRSPDKLTPLLALGAEAARTPVEAASGVDGVLMCLFDARAVEAVVFGADGLAQAQGLPWLVDHSSIDPAATRVLAQRLKDASGADWIDAPVSGGVPGVEAGTLAIMAGGAATHLPQARAAMQAYAGNVTHMGASGAGQATKLCNQTIVATTISAIAEALAGGWADSRPLQVFAPRMIEAQQHSIGALSTMLKDIDTVMANAQKSGAPMPVTASVQQMLRVAAAMGLGEAELSAVISVVQPERRDDFLPQTRH